MYIEKPKKEDELKVIQMMEKWKAFGGSINPGLLKKLNDDYNKWLLELENWSSKETCPEDEVPQTLYLCKSTKGDIIGAISLRHYLDKSNFVDGGHVAYGVCPEYRGNGYGNLLLKMAVEKLNEMGIKDILVTCDADNLISQKVILNNNGVLENQMQDDDGVPVNRYWIRT